MKTCLSRIACIAALVSAMAVPTMADGLKVAAVLPGIVTDKSFNQSVYEGLIKIKGSGVEVAYTEQVPQSGQVEAMSDYARRGYDVVIGAGAEFVDAGKRVAQNFPDLKVIVVNGAPTEGVSTVNFDNKQFGYLVGLVAGHSSQTGKVGSLSAQKVPSFENLIAGFEAGFKTVKPDGEMLVAYTNDWADIAKAKEASFYLISQNVDVLLPYLDAGIIGVAQAATNKQKYVIGVANDLSTEYPDSSLVSLVIDYGKAVETLVALHKDGKLEVKDYLIGPEITDIRGFHKSVGEDVKAKVATAVEEMKSGKLRP